MGMAYNCWGWSHDSTECMISYLPLSHVYEFAMECYLMYISGSVGFYQVIEVGYTGHIWGHILQYSLAILYRYLDTNFIRGSKKCFVSGQKVVGSSLILPSRPKIVVTQTG